MALETLRTSITHETTFQYIDRVDKRDSVYSFNVRPLGNKIELKLTREERTDEPLRVTLNPDGTWYAEHVLVVGER